MGRLLGGAKLSAAPSCSGHEPDREVRFGGAAPADLVPAWLGWRGGRGDRAGSRCHRRRRGHDPVVYYGPPAVRRRRTTTTMLKALGKKTGHHASS